MARPVRWIPALALMALLFALSAQPELGTGLGPLDLLLRKLGHMGAYAVLWLAVLYAVGERRAGVATVLALAYAISDEWHQTFVAGRNGAAHDVAIDALGMMLAAGAWLRWRRGRVTLPSPAPSGPSARR
ncbi:MAG TPA: VanZ family protein [Thermoleophilaceae bacterium]|nr:VanZ family protein [Thermoleophilaceae bacterium]